MLQAMLKNLFIESVGCIGMIGLESVSLSGRYFWMIVCGKEKLKLCECEKKKHKNSVKTWSASATLWKLAPALGLDPFSLRSGENKCHEMPWVWTAYETLSNQAHCTSICSPSLSSQIACRLKGWKARAIVTLPAIASAYAPGIQSQTFAVEYHGEGGATSLPSIATLELCHQKMRKLTHACLAACWD